MASGRSLDATLDRLRELEEAGPPEARGRELRRCLRSTRGIAAGKAAAIAGRKGHTELIPDLVLAFERFLKNPVKTDPGCRAKCGIVEALTALNYRETDLFIRGLHHVQKEPAWGPPVDTADRLRGLCAYALYAAGHPRLHAHLVDLLQDPEPVARTAAVQVLGSLDVEVSELLLRMKARQGDPEPEVLGECLGALMRMAPQSSLSFVAEFLDRDDSAATEAAFALAESRHPEAADLLIKTRTNRVGPARDGLLLPIALTRQESAQDYLLDVITEEHLGAADTALRALATQPVTRGQSDRIAAAVRGRESPALEAALKEAFSP